VFSICQFSLEFSVTLLALLFVVPLSTFFARLAKLFPLQDLSGDTVFLATSMRLCREANRGVSMGASGRKDLFQAKGCANR
jgi:hypothetical protein